jgi:hypothetical protein
MDGIVFVSCVANSFIAISCSRLDRTGPCASPSRSPRVGGSDRVRHA